MLFGRYIGTVTESGLWWVNPFTIFSRIDLAPRARLPDRADQGQRRARQPDRHRRRHRVAHDRHARRPCSTSTLPRSSWSSRARPLSGIWPATTRMTITPTAAGVAPRGKPTRSAKPPARAPDAVAGRRHRGDRDQADPSGLRARDRRGDAAPPAGRGDPRGPQDDGPGCRWTRPDGAGALADTDLVELDAERKAAMVANLMVVLSGDRSPTPVINTGSLYT